MGRLDNIGNSGLAINAHLARKGVQSQASVMEQLLEEQRTTNRLLWTLLSDEQKQAYMQHGPAS